MKTVQENNALNIPEIGLLTVIHVFVEFDYPICFVSQDIFGTRFLVQKIFSENDEEHRWLLVKLTKKRYHDLLNNKISLEKALAKQETSSPIWFLYVESSNRKNELHKFIELPTELLPSLEKETFVGITSSLNEEDYETMQYAKKYGIGVLDIIFATDNHGKLPALYVEKASAAIRKFCFPERENSRDLSFTMLSGSTVLRFEIDDIENLLDENSPHNKIKQISELFSNPAKINTILDSDSKMIRRFNDIVTNIASVKSNEIIVTSAFPSSQAPNISKFNRSNLKQIRKELSEIEETVKTPYKIQAILVGIESDHQTVRYEYNGEKIKAFSKINLKKRDFRFGQVYSFEIEEIMHKYIVSEVTIKTDIYILSIKNE